MSSRLEVVGGGDTQHAHNTHPFIPTPALWALGLTSLIAWTIAGVLLIGDDTQPANLGQVTLLTAAATITFLWVCCAGINWLGRANQRRHEQFLTTLETRNIHAFGILTDSYRHIARNTNARADELALEFTRARTALTAAVADISDTVADRLDAATTQMQETAAGAYWTGQLHRQMGVVDPPGSQHSQAVGQNRPPAATDTARGALSIVP